MIGQEDQKQSITKFEGYYNRGSADEVPIDHAQALLNVKSTSQSRVQTREGTSVAFTVGYSGGIRRFFDMTSLPSNVGQPAGGGDPDATAGDNVLILDNANNLYIGNDPTPIINVGGMADFSAVNMGNRTYVSPNNGIGGFSGGNLLVVNPQTGGIRLAAGLAPAQTGSLMSAAETATTGNNAPGVHQFAVAFQTDTGFWTPPGPKQQFSGFPATASTSAGAPTVFAISNHGMVTGESHTIRGATGSWAIVNGTWHITAIDSGHFSIPVDTFGLGSLTGSLQIDGPFVAATVNAVGGFTIQLTNIPTGPSFCTGRVLLATQANLDTFFFVPNVPGCQGVIQDNTTTSVTLNFFDTDLTASADYLFDLLEVIPGGGGITKYRNRMVISGPFFPGNLEQVLLSNVLNPETFNYVSGVVQVQTENDDNVVSNVFVLRDTLYMQKFTGTFSTEDNGGDPDTWAVTTVDAIIGAYPYGNSSFTVSQNSPDTGDMVIVAHKSGLYIFNGMYTLPELSWKIWNYWNRINFAYFYRVTVALDPWNKLIYVTAPLDTATNPNTMIVVDYSTGLDSQSVRFYIYSFPWNAACIGMFYYSGEYSLKIGVLTDTNLYQLDTTKTDDNGTTIQSSYSPGPITFGLGGLNFFKLLNFRAWGTGRLNLTLAQEDNQNTVTPPYLTLTATPGRELQRQINFTNEKLNLTFASGTTKGDMMFIDRVDVWGLMRWPLRPAV